MDIQNLTPLELSQVNAAVLASLSGNGVSRETVERGAAGVRTSVLGGTTYICDSLPQSIQAISCLSVRKVLATPASAGVELEIHQELKAEIEQAKKILDLEDDWDGEGSSGYSEDTLNRAISFLKNHIEPLWSLQGIRSPIPTIGPGPDGSIDLHWKQPSWELLVNIPSDPSEMATFYGDNYGAQRIRGSLDPQNVNSGILAWLMN